MFFTRYENLCKSKNKTTTGVASELGIAKSTVAYWRANDNVIPKQDVLLKIANYFDVSIGYLLDVEDNPNSFIKCPICDYTYDINDEIDVQHHDERHIRFITAKKFFGDYLIRLRDEEGLKAASWNIINNTENYDFNDIRDAVIDLYSCWFSRSVSANNYDLNHPKFDEYAAMLLFQPHQQEIVLKKIPAEVKEDLINKYGQKDGIPDGETVFWMQSEEKANKIIKFPSITDDDIKFALWGDVADEIPNDKLQEVKNFAEFIKNTYKKDNNK